MLGVRARTGKALTCVEGVGASPTICIALLGTLDSPSSRSMLTLLGESFLKRVGVVPGGGGVPGGGAAVCDVKGDDSGGGGGGA